MQTRKWSAIEQATSVITGFLVAQGLILYMIPLFIGTQIHLHDSIAISFVFTSVSFVRGYYIRRLFNRLHKKEIK